jgi:hypothetical protein
MKTMHGGAQLTMVPVRKNFWIPALKRNIKAVIHSCVVCFRPRAKLSQQVMGQLPSPHVQPSFPFMNVGVLCCIVLHCIVLIGWSLLSNAL